ncbi:hypothetical protein ACFY4C_12310 [Actinomadura viridis]|uniref:hypothetical protein n=1 Tax=Actinomadura viridis TaxID=58110 RepID=UPI0036C1428E
MNTPAGTSRHRKGAERATAAPPPARGWRRRIACELSRQAGMVLFWLPLLLPLLEAR